MKWIKSGRHYVTPNGEAKAHLYYSIEHVDVRYFIAGRYTFGRIVYFTQYGEPIRFKTIQEAKNYCQMKDDTAIIITGSVA